jgi:hypothetical protein
MLGCLIVGLASFDTMVSGPRQETMIAAYEVREDTLILMLSLFSAEMTICGRFG